MGTKFKISLRETIFLDFSRGNQPTRTLGLGYEIYLRFCVGVQKIFEHISWGDKYISKILKSPPPPPPYPEYFMTVPLLIVNNVYSTGMPELHMLLRALHITAILSIVVMFIPSFFIR